MMIFTVRVPSNIGEQIKDRQKKIGVPKTEQVRQALSIYFDLIKTGTDISDVLKLIEKDSK